LKRDYPSFGYMLENGATTLWETWEGEGSHNHPMFGSVSAWFYKYIAGIAPHPDAIAFSKVVFNPFSVKELAYAKVSIHTIRGTYAIHWSRKENGEREVEVVIPANCRAEIYVPLKDKGHDIACIFERNEGRYIWKQGESVENSECTFSRKENELMISLSSGTYSFQMQTTRKESVKN